MRMQHLLPTRFRNLGIAVLFGMGCLLAGISITHGIASTEPFVGRLLSAAALGGLALPLVAGSYWLWRRGLTAIDVWRVTGWALAGMLPLTGLALLTVYYQRVEGVILAEPWTIVAWVAGTGMVAGMVVGIYDFRRRRSQRDAQTTADRLQTIVDVAPIPIITTDPNGAVRDWNPAAEEIFGWAADEVQSDPYPLIPDEDTAEYHEHLHESPTGKALRGVETQRERKDGSQVPVQIWSASRYTDDEGLAETVIALADISTLKEREQTLQTLHEVGRDLVRAQSVDAVFERALDGVRRLFEEPIAGCWRYDEDTETLQPVCQTPTAAEVVGEQPVFEQGDSLAWEVFDTGDLAVFDDVRDRDGVYNPDTTMRTEIIVPLDEFGVLIVASSTPAAFDELDVEVTDSVAAAMETALDRAQREAELRRFKRAVEQAGHAVVITDREGTIEYVNPAFEEMTGYPSEEAVGQNPRLLKSGKHSEEFYAELWNTILSGDVWDAELIDQRKDGSLFQIDQTISPIMDSDGEITHFVGIESEITERRLREQRLSVLNRVLRHNIRNAMNVVRGNAETLAETLGDKDQQEQAAAIRNRANELLELTEHARKIRDLFNRETEADAACDVSALLSDLRDEFHDEYPEAELTITTPESALVQADDRLATAIREAVDNAVTHSDQTPPEVTVTVTPPERAETGEWVDILITDNGPGIPDQEQTVVEMGEETPLVHSSGIGLWLIHWVAVSFGGEVTIRENSPRGSIVTIRIPAATS